MVQINTGSDKRIKKKKSVPSKLCSENIQKLTWIWPRLYLKSKKKLFSWRICAIETETFRLLSIWPKTHISWRWACVVLSRLTRIPARCSGPAGTSTRKNSVFEWKQSDMFLTRETGETGETGTDRKRRSTTFSQNVTWTGNYEIVLSLNELSVRWVIIS